MTVALALLSSLLWGASDFLGGSATRRLPAVVVVCLSQASALALLVPVVLVAGDRPDHLWAAPLAGTAGALGLGAFYAALSLGTMGVVAPIAATGAAVPVVVGLVRGEAPSAVQVAGIVLALVGVVLASGPELSGGASRRPLVLAAAAAVCFGAVAVLLAEGSEGGPGAVVVTLLLMRVVSVTLMGLLLALRRTRLAVGGSVRVLVVVGVLDVAANAAFAFASRSGLLSVVAVLGSLYPVVTVLLAREVLGERLARIQVGGVVATLLGVALLSAG